MRFSCLVTTFCLVFALPAAAQKAVDGGKIVLEGSKAVLKGERLQLDAKTGVITGLAARPSETITWPVRVEKAGWYQVVVHYALKDGKKIGQAAWNATIGDQNRMGPIHATGASDRFLPQVLFNPMELSPGRHELQLQLKGAAQGLDLHISKVELVRAREPGIP